MANDIRECLLAEPPSVLGMSRNRPFVRLPERLIALWSWTIFCGVL